MDAFFDLHGVLADARAIGKRYEAHVARVLEAAGVDSKAARRIHGEVLARWVTAFRAASHIDDGDGFDEAGFMARMRRIDDDWETYLLDRIPEAHRETSREQLVTSTVEYDAMVAAPCEGVIYPDVRPALQRLQRAGITLHVASSASTNHVRGTIESCNLVAFFSCVIGYDAVRAPKKATHGLYFSRMLDLAGARGDASAFVGDSVEEGTLASARGMRYILVDRAGDAALRARAMAHGFPVVDGMDDVAGLLGA